MCLTTKQICPLKAKRDITVYKILCVNKVSPQLYTPFTYTPVCIGETMDASCQKTQEYRYKARRYEYLPTKDIGSGMIHSYTNEKTTMDIVKLAHTFVYWIIVECTIPKGTLYYISFDKTQICSKKLIINKIIHSNERKSQKD